ncbi:MAG: hypothetical protein LUC18_04710 [Porphyromonadaceae bacterium]|nr:hypothetical protein [Porphyromonadaceae bacterium]
MNDKFKKILVETLFAVLIIGAEIALLIVSHSAFVKICAVLIIVIEAIRIISIVLKFRKGGKSGFKL